MADLGRCVPSFIAIVGHHMLCDELERYPKCRVGTKARENDRLVVRSGFAEMNVHADRRYSATH
jgi:hypothetical protein